MPREKLITIRVPMRYCDVFDADPGNEARPDDVDWLRDLTPEAAAVMRHVGLEPDADDELLGAALEDALLTTPHGTVYGAAVPLRSCYEITGTREALTLLGFDDWIYD